jgi:hypothetical protein
MTLDLQGATRTETNSTLQEGWVCTWSGADGKQHTAASSNCYTAVPWFIPQIETQVTGTPAVLGRITKARGEPGQMPSTCSVTQAIIGSPQTAMDVTTVLQD